MLVLRRHVGQRILIGDEITVKVIEITRKIVKLGIVAPHDLHIDREELRERINIEGRRDREHG